MSEATARVQAGACGFTTVATARASGLEDVTFAIESNCETVAALALALGDHGPFNALSEIDPRTSSELLDLARSVLQGCCAGCVVPVALFKVMQVAAGLALPRDISVTMQPLPH